MATKVHMEALSPTMEEGQLVRWLKNEGDTVAEGDVLAEIETDKATMELVARGSGVLSNITLAEGATAPVGQVIAMIGEAGEAAAAAPAASAKQPTAQGAKPDAQGAKPDAQSAKPSPEAGDPAADAATPASTPKDEPETAAEMVAAEEPGGGADVAPDADSANAAVAVAGETEKPRVAQTGQSMVNVAPSTGASRSDESSKSAGDDDDGASDANGRVRASPLARRLATEAGLDIGDIDGTGPGGRITKRDIEAVMQGGARRPAQAASSQAASSQAASSQASAQAGSADKGTQGTGAAASSAKTSSTDVRMAPSMMSAGPESDEVPISQMRKTIAKRLVQSIGPIPTFYLTRDIDMTQVVEARERINRRLEKQGVKVSVNDIIIKAVAAALVRHPEVNASWGESSITRYNRAHIGVAVAVEDGLITPIVRNAEAKSIAAIAAEVRELAGRARDRKLKPEEYTGATFSISNLGMFGIDEFTAIINPPESAILAIGAVEDRVVAVNGAPAVQPRMKITMSCDHRVIDGASGAKFLQTLADLLEEPMMILV